jgi:hypothetical protein
MCSGSSQAEDMKKPEGIKTKIVPGTAMRPLRAKLAQRGPASARPGSLALAT